MTTPQQESEQMPASKQSLQFPDLTPEQKKRIRVIASHVGNINLHTNTMELDLVEVEIAYKFEKLLAQELQLQRRELEDKNKKCQHVFTPLNAKDFHCNECHLTAEIYLVDGKKMMRSWYEVL